MHRSYPKRFFLVGSLLILGVLAALPLVCSAERDDLDARARAQAPGDFVQLSRGAVHYDLSGPQNGTPVVLIHGFSVPYYTWDFTAAALAESGFRVLRYDLYGRGYSERPDVGYDRALFVEQLAELLDSLGMGEPIHVVGHSMGGAISVAFAADHPERVRHLALLAPFNTPVDIRPLNVPFLGEYLNRVYFVPSLPEGQLEDFSQPERFSDWPDRFREQMRFRGFERAILSTLREFMRYDPLPDYRAVGQESRRILVLWGDEDQVVPLRQNVRVREALGEPEWLVIPDAGHALHYEDAAPVSRALIDFLRQP